MPEGTERRANPLLGLERLGRRLKSARTDAGYRNTQEVAKVIGRRFNLPVAAITLGRYERGETLVPLDILLALSFVYEQPVDHFLRPALVGDAARDYERLND